MIGAGDAPSGLAIAATISGVMGFLGAIVAGVVAWHTSRVTALPAEVTAIYGGMSGLITHQQDVIVDLERRLAAVEADHGECREKNRAMARQVARLQAQVDGQPPPDDT